MDEDDHDELLQSTDDESTCTEDQDNDQNEASDTITLSRDTRCFSMVHKYSKFEFLVTKLCVIFSSAVLMVSLPAYMDSNSIQGDAYNFILINSTLAIVCFTFIFLTGQLFFKTYKHIRLYESPLKFRKIVLTSILYTLAGFLVIFAVDKKKVMCHLQDPMRGCILIFSLLYYFVFSKRVMSSQSIFSTSTIAGGIFIAIDYCLCNEFKCRGFERVRVSDDKGDWSWKVHSTWIILYVLGLALYAGFFTLVERFLSSKHKDNESTDSSSSFLTTISRSVAFPVMDSENNERTAGLSTDFTAKKLSSVHLTLHIHSVSWIIILLSFWTYYIPYIGKGSSISDLLDSTSKSIVCHFKPRGLTEELDDCGNTFFFSWLFLGFYVVFSITTTKFLIMSQSAVYTVACISSSLPLVGIWWGFFQLHPLQNGGSVMVWSPAFSMDLISSIMGVPLVLIGLLVFCKSHFKDLHKSDLTAAYDSANSQFAF